jgi:hypothetical protein
MKKIKILPIPVFSHGDASACPKCTTAINILLNQAVLN